MYEAAVACMAAKCETLVPSAVSDDHEGVTCAGCQYCGSCLHSVSWDCQGFWGFQDTGHVRVVSV
jgi:hypothetical protein